MLKQSASFFIASLKLYLRYSDVELCKVILWPVAIIKPSVLASRQVSKRLKSKSTYKNVTFLCLVFIYHYIFKS